MNTQALFATLTFAALFFVSPGPVWVAVMEATRTRSPADIARFALTVFLPAALLIQGLIAAACVVFMTPIAASFERVGTALYIMGGSYIAYLAVRVMRQRQTQAAFTLRFRDLAIIMMTSPKVWLLFPVGAISAVQISPILALNASLYALVMMAVAQSFFVLYAAIGKLLTRWMDEAVTYLSAGLLALFALYLWWQAIVAMA